MLSTAPLGELEALAEERRWRISEALTLGGYRADVDTQSTRWAFEYLGLLALISAVVALGSLAFYLSERRRQRAVTTVMARQIGVSPGALVGAGITELVALVALAIAAGSVAAAVTAREVFGVFEPDPEIPPTIRLAIDLVRIGSVYGIVLVAVAVLAAQSQMRALRADRSTVLRG